MRLKITSLKFLDILIGIPLIYFCRLIPPRKNCSNIDFNNKKPIEDKLRILVIRPGGIGDMVLLFPSIKLLREQFPNSEIDLLAEKRNFEILEISNYVSEILKYDSNPIITLYKIITSNYDIVIDSEQWHRLTSVITYITRAPIRVGYNTNDRSILYSHPVDFKHSDYEADSFLNLVTILTAKNSKFQNDSKFIKLSNYEDTDNLRSFEAFKDKYKKVIGIFTGATVKERKWEAVNYASVVNKLINDGIGIVVLGGKTEIPESKIFKTSIGINNYLDLTAKTSLRETTEIISGLDMLLSSDSGLMHIAYGLGVPTVSLFGAGIKPKWAPRGRQNIIIDKELPCSPCTKFGYTPECDIHVRCLTEISVDEVYNACSKVLDIN